MIHIPVLRWGEPYKSLDIDQVVHFATGEPLAEVSRANGGLIERDMRHAKRARDVLREIPIPELINRVRKAADLIETGIGNMSGGSALKSAGARAAAAVQFENQ